MSRRRNAACEPLLADHRECLRLVRIAADEHSTDVSADSKGAERLKLIQSFALRKLESLPETQLAFSFHAKRIVVRKLVLKAIQAISAFKPIISGAVSAEPHAALAWAGIMTILPVNPAA
jgi:hypothetical protein